MAEESKYETTLRETVEKHKGLCIKLLTFMFKGLPDRLVLLPGGRIAFVELKSIGKKPGKFQAYVHKKLRALGFAVWVVNSREQLNDFFKHYELCYSDRT